MSQIQCSKCLNYKDSEEFNDRIEKDNGKRSWCKECTEGAAFKWRIEHPEQVRKNKRLQYLRKRHVRLKGVTKYCEICGTEFDPEIQIGSKIATSPHWDHNHATEEFRGWLCHNHNAMLGHAGDNPEILRKGAEYLERHGYSVTQILKA